MFIETAVTIIGAGPGGAACALKLNALGIPCVVFDKAIFPRDKVCGDGLSGKVINILNKIDPQLASRFRAFQQKQESWGVEFVSPGRYVMPIAYKKNYDTSSDLPIGFVCKRIDFDNFLVQELKSCKNVRLFEGVTIQDYTFKEDSYLLYNTEKNMVVRTSLLVVAGGAQSNFGPGQATSRKTGNYFSAGVRGYFRHVKGLHPDKFIELHFLRDLLPGYLWIFPLPDGETNVGLDMLTSEVSKRKINLRKLLMETLANDPVLKERFEGAELIGKISGYGLPLAGDRRPISGDRFLLVGDAASLIDPLTGEGIGNAMYSGSIAAAVVATAISENNYSAKKLGSYDREVNRLLGHEFKLSQRLQKTVRYRRLFDWLMKRGSKSKTLQELISGMLYDMNLRKQLVNPLFYFRLLFKK
jgi:geranylgeranyl reductase family protein